jgi:hypothetical protein
VLKKRQQLLEKKNNKKQRDGAQAEVLDLTIQNNFGNNPIN